MKNRKTKREPDERRPPTVALFFFVFAIAVAGSLIALDAMPLIGFSEGRYATIAAEMIASGDLVTPRYSGIEHFEKPPLAYWLAALGIHQMGHSEAAVRAPAAVSGIVVAMLTFWLGATAFGIRVGALASLVLLCFPLHLIFSRALMTDMILAAGTTLHVAAVLALGRESQGRASRIGLLLLSGLGIGIAILTKFHLVLLLATLPLIVESILARDRRLAWAALHPLSWGVGIAMLLPWAIAILDRNPGIFEWVLEYQTRDRLFSVVHDRDKPIWIYLMWLPMATLPLLLCLPSIGKPWLAEGALAKRGILNPRRFMLLWFVLPFIVFSLIGSKRINYLPPILPPLALLLAEGLAAGRSPEVARGLPWLVRVVLGLLALALVAPWFVTIAPWFGIEAADATLPMMPTMGIGIGALIALFIHELARRRARRAPAAYAARAQAFAAVTALAIALAIAIPCATHVAGSKSQKLTTHRFAAFAARPYVMRGVPLVAYYLEVSSLGFYLEGRTAILVGSPRQVLFEDPEVLARQYFPDVTDEEKARFDGWLATARELVFVTKVKYIPSLEKRIGAPLEIIHQGEHFTVARMSR